MTKRLQYACMKSRNLSPINLRVGMRVGWMIPPSAAAAAAHADFLARRNLPACGSSHQPTIQTAAAASPLMKVRHLKEETAITRGLLWWFSTVTLSISWSLTLAKFEKGLCEAAGGDQAATASE